MRGPFVRALVTGLLIAGAVVVHAAAIPGLLLVAAVFVSAERRWALHDWPARRPGWRTDVVHLLVNRLLVEGGLIVVVVAVGLGLRAAVPGQVGRGLQTLPAVAQFCLAVAIAELGGYAGHRMSHRVPWLWRFHRVHHDSERLDWLASAHQHPVDAIIGRACVALPIFALRFSAATFGAYLTISTLHALWIHSNLRTPVSVLGGVIVTPAYHHWHHAGDPAAYDSNFAGQLPVIDRIFGTRCAAGPAVWPDSYGAGGQASGYLAQLASPWRALRRA